MAILGLPDGGVQTLQMGRQFNECRLDLHRTGHRDRAGLVQDGLPLVQGYRKGLQVLLEELERDLEGDERKESDFSPWRVAQDPFQFFFK